MGPGSLTVASHVEAEGGLQLADVVAGADVQTVDAGGGEGVVELQGVVVQHGQGAAGRRVRTAVLQETPANPHGGTGDTRLLKPKLVLREAVLPAAHLPSTWTSRLESRDTV